MHYSKQKKIIKKYDNGIWRCFPLLHSSAWPLLKVCLIKCEIVQVVLLQVIFLRKNAVEDFGIELCCRRDCIYIGIYNYRFNKTKQ